MKAIEPDIGVRVGLKNIQQTINDLGRVVGDDAGEVWIADHKFDERLRLSPNRDEAAARLREWTQDVLDQAAAEYGNVVDTIMAATLEDKFAIVAPTG